MAVGAYIDPTPNNKIVGSIPAKVTRALQLVENDELYDKRGK